MTTSTNTTYTPSYAEKAWDAVRPMGAATAGAFFAGGAASDLFVRTANVQLDEANAPFKVFFTPQGAKKIFIKAGELGIKAGGVVGTQMVLTEKFVNPVVRNIMTSVLPRDVVESDGGKFGQMVVGAGALGIASSAPLHVFTCAGADRSARQAMGTYTPKIAMKYGLQEAPFLVGMQAGRLLESQWKEKHGDSPLVAPVSDAISGAIAGLLSNPATANLQRAAAGFKTPPNMWLKGSLFRMPAIATFTVVYNALTRKAPNNTA